jgi:purine-binding chemotaxis protein CheW
MQAMNTDQQLPRQLPVADTQLRQYLVFHLGGLEYGMDYRKVRELRPLNALERVADGGELVPGVALSRGIIMPIVDMRVAFGPRPPRDATRTDVVILQLASCVMGMVTDGVTDVLTLSPQQIRPLPQAGKDVDYLLGIGTVGARRLILLDIERLMAIRSAHLGSRHAA